MVSKKDQQKATDWAVNEIVQIIFRRSQENLTEPFGEDRYIITDTGLLLESGRIIKEGKQLRITYSADYACIVGPKTGIISDSSTGTTEVGMIKEGISVLGKDGKFHKVQKKLNHQRVYEKPDLMLLRSEKSRTKKGLVVTCDHLILTVEGEYLIWKRAEEFQTGDFVFRKRKTVWNKGNSDFPREKECIGCGDTFIQKDSSFHDTIFCSQMCYHENTLHNRSEGKRWKLTTEQRRKKSGSNNPAWKGGTSKEPYGPEWNKVLKEQIKKRDGHLCRECSLSEQEATWPHHVHHKDGNKYNNHQDNLETLCVSCHGKQQWKDAELVTVDLEQFEPVRLTTAKRTTASEWFGENAVRRGALKKARLYDLVVDGENSFVAGGILVHNSDVEYGADPRWVDLKDLKKWVRRKLGMTNQRSQNVIAKNIQKKIAEYGTTERPYLRNARDLAIHEFIQKYSGKTIKLKQGKD